MGVLSVILAVAWISGVDSSEAMIRREIETIAATLDTGAYQKAASVPEQIVLAYQWAQQRPPSGEELQNLAGLARQFDLRPSEILAFAIRGGNPEITWEMCGQFVARKGARPQPSAETKRLAAELLAAPLPEDEYVPGKSGPAKPYEKEEPGVVYETFFGYLHAHSNLSDGTGSPDLAYIVARAAGLDFFALTDHGELMRVWPWDNKWEQLNAAADRADAPGEFAALSGFEWSSPTYGHLTIVNSSDYTDCVSHSRLPQMYDWLAGRSEAFGRFNHPGVFDFAVLDLLHFRPFDHVKSQMVGVECWNENDGFDKYHYGCNWKGAPTYLDLANVNGWRVAPLGGEDNHQADWGQMGRFRTGVLATDLSREAIVDAYVHRRFYATEDDNLCLDFRCNGYPMGSVLDEEPRVFEVTAFDRDAEDFVEVRLYRNGRIIETKSVDGAEVVETFEDDSTEDAYYYVVVRQADDSDWNGRNDEAISSPIWFGTLDGFKSGCYSPLLKGRQAVANYADLAVLFVAATVLGLKKRF